MFEKRIHERCLTFNRCKAEIDSSENVWIKDISLGGACVKTPVSVPAGCEQRLKIYIPGKKDITLERMAVWSLPSDAQADKEDILLYYETGMVFTDLTKHKRKILNRMINCLSE
jgi:hypothetical protein